jgi:hypothetical protein
MTGKGGMFFVVFWWEDIPIKKPLAEQTIDCYSPA